jgi:single-strand DNA-binding protein
MANFNKVFLMGNMTRDPELRYTPNGTPLCEFGLAIDRSYKTRDGEQRDEVCFVDVTMWGRRGIVISEYFTKGKPIFVEGRLKYDTWETADGRHSKLSVVAENFEFLGAPGQGEPRSDRAGSGRQAGGGSERSSRGRREEEARSDDSPEESGGEGYDVSDDEIPF